MRNTAPVHRLNLTLPFELVMQARQYASENGTTITDLIRQALDDIVGGIVLKDADTELDNNPANPVGNKFFRKRLDPNDPSNPL